MQITWKWIEEKSACADAKEWGRAKYNGTEEKTGVSIVRDLMEADKLQWANWLIVRLMDKPNQVRYAIFSAEKVLDIFEKEYPKDDRPRKAIEAAKVWLEAPTDDSRAKAKAAAHAAAYAADAAAAYAAYAYAAAYAADAAAAYADADAARRKLQIEVLEYGLKLLSRESKERPHG
jgi:hypothetical protein